MPVPSKVHFPAPATPGPPDARRVSVSWLPSLAPQASELNILVPPYRETHDMVPWPRATVLDSFP